MIRAPPRTRRRPAVILDLAWPSGVQRELTPPVALLIDEPHDVWRAAVGYGFRVFTDPAEVRGYCEDLILTGTVEAGSLDDDIGDS